ncbi:hypothetical protein SCACP_15880 [Sporomusa carbonis]|uniref:YraN family protein n=1 Tax=Sporomusa carbonis TaxID=3076075 RepID=UPI003A6C95CA
MNHIAVGDKGEQFAVNYLSRLGYHIIVTKYRAKTGEVDIVAKDKDCLVFIEVKTRRSTVYGFPAEAVNFKKQQKIINTALCFLNQRRLIDVPCRFDILEVYLQADSVKVNHIINAFGR